MINIYYNNHSYKTGILIDGWRHFSTLNDPLEMPANTLSTFSNWMERHI